MSDLRYNTLTRSDENKWIPRVLVIGPGGIKGIKILGFLSPLEDSGLFDHIDTYCGVSVGAVIALLIICGYQVREIVGEATKLDLFSELGSLSFKSLIENKGFMSLEPIRKLLTQLVINKFGSVPTLYGLYMRTCKSFVAVTLNATDETCVMLDPFTTPDISCVDAALFSMNIPFLFYQIIYHNKIYVDGALANCYPVDYFDDGRTNILGIYMKTINKINTTASVVGSNFSNPIAQKIDESSKALSASSYISKIFHSLMDHRRNQIMQSASDHCRHVCLETSIVDTTGYSVTVNDKALMLVEGFNEGRTFLSQIQSNTYARPKIPEKQSYRYPPNTLGEI